MAVSASDVQPSRNTSGELGAKLSSARDRAAEAFGTRTDAFGDDLAALHRNMPVGKDMPVMEKYHSYFCDLFSWKYPRATGSVAGGLFGLIVLSHTMNIPRFLFRSAWILLAATGGVEFVSKLLMGGKTGIISSLRPQRYLAVSDEAAAPVLAEIHQLINFVLLEGQRLFFADNLVHTFAAFVVSYFSYQLVRFMPLCGLFSLGLFAAFTVPPFYFANRQAIETCMQKTRERLDEHYKKAKSLASEHASTLSEQARSTTSEWRQKTNMRRPKSPEEQRSSLLSKSPDEQQSFGTDQQSKDTFGNDKPSGNGSHIPKDMFNNNKPDDKANFKYALGSADSPVEVTEVLHLTEPLQATPKSEISGQTEDAPSNRDRSSAQAPTIAEY